MLFCFLYEPLSSQDNNYPIIDTSDFTDAAHHWHDIKDKGNTINPRPGHPVCRSDEMQAVLTAEQKDSLIKAKK